MLHIAIGVLAALVVWAVAGDIVVFGAVTLIRILVLFALGAGVCVPLFYAFATPATAPFAMAAVLVFAIGWAVTKIVADWRHFHPKRGAKPRH